MTRLTTLLLALLPLSVGAQAWRMDEYESDVLLLGVLICLGVGVFWIRQMHARGRLLEGLVVLAIIGLLAAMLPAARAVLAVGAAGVLVYGMVWRT